MHYWVRASSSDFSGLLPKPRSGHSAVNVGKSYVIVFGGFANKRFLADMAVYDAESRIWFQPVCTGSGSDAQLGPSPRAFHVCVAIDCHMFIFGGRSGSKRLGDFWVLDTDIWQWTELTSFGDLPSARDFAAASAIGNRKIVMFGGWDGKKWLSDVYVLDTISLEWTELSIAGSSPPVRCGHTATMLEKRFLVYGGRGGGGPVMGDLWALKGLIEEENEAPGWTQLKLPGKAPSPRCGHTFTSGGHYLLLFGGHGTGGWLSRYDIYYNDCVVLDRVSAQWKQLPTGNETPSPRAYHSITYVSSRFLLFGGFDGKSTYGDLWWLVPEEDPIVKRLDAAPPGHLPDNEDRVMENNAPQSAVKEREESAFLKLQRLEISAALSIHKLQIVEESEDHEFLELASRLIGTESCNEGSPHVKAAKVRDYWRKSTPSSISLKELGPLLRDYQRLVTRQHITMHADLHSTISEASGTESYRFYHMKDASQLRMDDIPCLLVEYKQLLADHEPILGSSINLPG